MAMPVDHEEWVRIYGDTGTGVHFDFGQTGIVLPTTLTPDPGAGLIYLGLLAEGEGIKMNTEKDKKEFHALQGGKKVRSRVGKVGQKFTFVCLEDSAPVAELAYMNPVVISGDGASMIATQDISSNQARSTRGQMVIDSIDIDIIDRYTCELVEVTFQGEVQLANLEELRAYAFEAEILKNCKRITNSPGMIAA